MRYYVAADVHVNSVLQLRHLPKFILNSGFGLMKQFARIGEIRRQY